MIKTIQLTCLLSISLLYGDLRIEAVGSDLNISINNNSFILAHGHSRDINCSKKLKVLDGKGELVILKDRKEIKAISKGDETFILPKHQCQNFMGKIATATMDSIQKFFFTEETIHAGEGSKGNTKSQSLKRNITIDSSYKKIKLSSDKWGYYNFKLAIIRNNREEITMIFDDKKPDNVSFTLPVKELEDNDVYQIFSCVDGDPVKCQKKNVLAQSGVITIN